MEDFLLYYLLPLLICITPLIVGKCSSERKQLESELLTFEEGSQKYLNRRDLLNKIREQELGLISLAILPLGNLLIAFLIVTFGLMFWSNGNFNNINE